MRQIHILTFFLVLLSLTLGVTNTYGQNNKKTNLEAKQKKLQKDISYTRKLINETKNQRQASLSQISLLNNQINNRKALIRSYGVEITMLEQKVASNKKLIIDLQKEIENLKIDYASLIEQSYKTRNKMDKWVFIISSEDFYQGYQRYKYLERINDIRREKVDRIVNAQKELEKTNIVLEQQKQQRVGLMIEKETETSKLNDNKTVKQRKANQLRTKEKELKNKLKKQQRENTKIRNQIKKIIRDLANKNIKTNKTVKKTDWEIALAKDFISNKGKLPWPTANGKVTDGYGAKRHPDFPNIEIINDGVNIRCEKGTVARSVFKGVVTDIFLVPQGKAVMVEHGNYFTVYKNLSDVYVAVGDEVDTKQAIGMVHTLASTNETMLQFMIWYHKGTSTSTQNPASWVYRLK